MRKKVSKDVWKWKEVAIRKVSSWLWEVSSKTVSNIFFLSELQGIYLLQYMISSQESENAGKYMHMAHQAENQRWMDTDIIMLWKSLHGLRSISEDCQFTLNTKF